MGRKHISEGSNRFKRRDSSRPVLAEDIFSYTVKDGLNMFQLDNPDIELFNLIDGELLKLAGSEMFIYKYHRVESQDDVYAEDREKVIDPAPIKVFGHYEPRSVEEVLTDFGLELENDQVFTFNKTDVERAVGRRLIPGDIIKPIFQDLFFEIFEVQEASFEVYGVYHLLATAKIFRDVENRIPSATGDNPLQ